MKFPGYDDFPQHQFSHIANILILSSTLDK
jgi:hypothetical protein